MFFFFFLPRIYILRYRRVTFLVAINEDFCGVHWVQASILDLWVIKEEKQAFSACQGCGTEGRGMPVKQHVQETGDQEGGWWWWWWLRGRGGSAPATLPVLCRSEESRDSGEKSPSLSGHPREWTWLSFLFSMVLGSRHEHSSRMSHDIGKGITWEEKQKGQCSSTFLGWHKFSTLHRWKSNGWKAGIKETFISPVMLLFSCIYVWRDDNSTYACLTLPSLSPSLPDVPKNTRMSVLAHLSLSSPFTRTRHLLNIKQIFENKRLVFIRPSCKRQKNPAYKMYLDAEANTIKGTTWCYLNNTRNWFSLRRCWKIKDTCHPRRSLGASGIRRMPLKTADTVRRVYSESMMSNISSESRTRWLEVIAPGFWRHWITLALRHQNQMPRVLSGSVLAVRVHKDVSPFPQPNKKHMRTEPGVCVHLCPGSSDYTVHCAWFSGNASFKQWTCVYTVNCMTTLQKPKIQMTPSCY